MKAISTDIIYVAPGCPPGVYRPSHQWGTFRVGDFDEEEPSTDFLCKLSFGQTSGGTFSETIYGNLDNCPNYDFEMQYYIKGCERRKAIAKKVGDKLTNCVVVTDSTVAPFAHVYVRFDNPRLGKGTLMRRAILYIPDFRAADGTRRVVYETELGTIE